MPEATKVTPEGPRTMKGTVFEVLMGHVGGLDGENYFAEDDLDGELITAKLAATLKEKGIIRVKPAKQPKKKAK